MTRSLRLYIASVTLAFWGGLVAACLNGGMPSLNHPAELAPLFGIAVAAEALVVHRRQKSGNDSFSFSATAHVAVAVLFGPVVAGIVAALTVVVVDGMRLADRDVIMMNSSLFGISAALSGSAFIVAGGTVGTVDANDALPLVALIVVRFAANEVILSGAVALSRGQRFLRVLRDGMRATAGGSMGEGSLGVLIAFGYSSERWVILPFLAPLLAALYQSRSNLERLRNETDDALNALAGVIDERDPSTAEHSSRVAALVERFVEAIGLPDREAERLVAAARFHDLGKVAVDVATLSKDGRLTEEELRAIRSHPRLSARLLEPFHFAEHMALYAELHHERYDGQGYYAVSQREIPVEAHVLIVADSYDAMISKRAYRPALTEREAVQELRDKAGSQFHPLVANAFAAMVEGTDVEAVVGRQQLAALKAEFSRIPTVRWPHVFTPDHLTVPLAAATALVAVGFPGVPTRIALGLGVAAVLTASAQLIQNVRARRRTAASLSVVRSGGLVSDALRGAGLDGHAVWLELRPETLDYGVVPNPEVPLSAETAMEISRRALRPGERGLRGPLSGGAWVEITPAVRPDGHRLAFVCDRTLSAFERGLLAAVAERSRLAPASLAAVDRRDDTRTKRPLADSRRPVALIVDLGAFEDVRLAAGQLSAERVTTDAWGRLRALLRESDELVRIDEDRFGIVLHVTDDSQVHAVGRRVTETLAEVPVPRRAAPVRPTLHLLHRTELESDPALSGLLRRLDPPSTPRRAA